MYETRSNSMMQPNGDLVRTPEIDALLSRWRLGGHVDYLWKHLAPFYNSNKDAFHSHHLSIKENSGAKFSNCKGFSVLDDKKFWTWFKILARDESWLLKINFKTFQAFRALVFGRSRSETGVRGKKTEVTAEPTTTSVVEVPVVDVDLNEVSKGMMTLAERQSAYMKRAAEIAKMHHVKNMPADEAQLYFVELIRLQNNNEDMQKQLDCLFAHK